MMELTTRFGCISTSDKKRGKAITSHEAVNKAKANLRYIDRRSAVRSGNAKGANLRNPDGELVSTKKEGRAALRRAIEARAKSGGANGSRVAEKIMFSLPNDFEGKPARIALSRVLKRLVGDSDAVAFGVIHTDKPDNLHCHILAVDGPESLDSAKKRNPKAKRVRRRNYLRMHELGKPRELRAMIAEEINFVAKKFGLSKVEHRSFDARGIKRLPGRHIGPQASARMAREEASARGSRPRAQGRFKTPVSRHL